jgi:drug/metabolite transporter (DMT)-like permease
MEEGVSLATANNALAGPLGGERPRAIGLLVLTAILWSTGGLLIKWVPGNPIAIAGARSAIASLLLLAFIRRPNFTWSFSQIGGAIAYAVTVMLFVSANKLTTAANAILLQYTSPVYVALLGTWFLGEETTWLDWVTIILTLGGMSLFFLDDLALGGFWGNILAIATGITFACLVVFLRRQKDGSPLESILLGNILAALIGLPFVLNSRPGLLGCIGLGLLGVFQLGLPYILYSLAIKSVTALEAILVPVIEPILSPLWVFLVMGEVPGPWALVGGLVVLASVTARCALAATLPRGRANGMSGECTG